MHNRRPENPVEYVANYLLKNGDGKKKEASD